MGTRSGIGGAWRRVRLGGSMLIMCTQDCGREGRRRLWVLALLGGRGVYETGVAVCPSVEHMSAWRVSTRGQRRSEGEVEGGWRL